jgi:hypothetical protein
MLDASPVTIELNCVSKVWVVASTLQTYACAFS